MISTDFLSKIRGADALDLIAEVIEPASAIFGDDEIREMLKNGDKKATIIKIVCKKYNSELLSILAICNGKNVNEFNPTAIEIIAQAGILFGEVMKDVTPIFTSAGQTTDEPSSTSPTTITTADEIN